MPAVARKKDDRYRVVDKDTGLVVRNASGTPADGGGHMTFERARKQASAININQARQAGSKIPQR